MKKLYVLVLALASIASASAQTFTAGTLPGSYHSGGVTGVWDMNNDGLNDIVVMDNSTTLRVLYQNPNGSFTQANTATQALGASQWGMTVADVNNDGFGDVVCGGAYDNLRVYYTDGSGNATVTSLPVSIFTQAVTLGDINNDGWLDFFSCHDDGPARFWRNDGTGNLEYQNSYFIDPVNDTLIDYNLYPGNYPGTSDPLMSGNYGNEFCDFDRDGDLDLLVAKCRQASNDPYDVRRTNILFVNDGTNHYTEDAHNRGLVNLQQTWTATFGDVDNDGDFDCLMTTHSGTLEMYKNDGTGHFTNITAGSGLEVAGFFMQGQMADFDNDGLLDVIFAGGNFGYYHNNGNYTWTQMNSAFSNPSTMHGFALGDLNNDGFVDVYAGYGNSGGYVTPGTNADRVQINGANSNHWIAFDLEGVISNKNSVGAQVELHGAFGIQVREVRSGVSYGITNSNMLNFGIGANTSIDYAIIRWPSGITKVITNPAIDQYHQYYEVDCSAPTATITSQGSTFLCVGQSVDLSASSTGNFVWNTGSTASTITVSEPGIYYAYAYDGTGCASVSNMITVNYNTSVQAPTVVAGGQLDFCQGLSVALTATQGAAYLWSNGEQTQTIYAAEPGTYTCQVDNGCGFQNSANSIDVIVYAAPSAPASSDVQVGQSGVSVDLSATGTNLSWYDVATGGSPLATGSTFTTPAITSFPATFWVEDAAVYGGVQGVGGKSTNDAANGQYFTTTPANYNKFDALTDVILDSVLVFSNAAGVRTIEVIDANLNVVATGDFDIANGSVYVPVNFFIPQGTGYGLRTTTATPNLWRDRNITTATPYNYPYDVNGLISITGTTVTNANQNQDGDNYYYFFYDWHAHTPEFTCAGPRTEVTINFVGVEEITSLNNVVVFPNPAEETLTVRVNANRGGAMYINLIDEVGRTVQMNQVTVSTGTQNFELNLSNLASGIYQVQLVKDGQSASQRVVVK
jgi:ASPIC and UnbV/Secretion system C-terminal sorting domain/FG-GAP-like repeat/Ig-like domain CHU_C associated